MRRSLALVVGAVAAAFGALVFGEYQFTGASGVLYGALVGIFVAEAVVLVDRPARLTTAAACAVIAGAGVWWAAWISVGGRHTHAPIPGMGWLAIVVGGAVAAVTATSPWRRVRGSRRVP